MGQVWELVGTGCKAGGMPEHIIDHFDRIGSQLGFDSVEVHYDADAWVMSFKVGRWTIPLRCEKTVPPELLTDKLADELVKEIRAAMAEDDLRKKALADFNAQPLIGQVPSIKH